MRTPLKLFRVAVLKVPSFLKNINAKPHSRLLKEKALKKVFYFPYLPLN
jgi:hypothetical protein